MNLRGDKTPTIGESKNILHGQVDAYLEIDTALFCKIEQGERRPTRDQVIKLDMFYRGKDKELVTPWLSDKLIGSIEKKSFAIQALNKANTILKALP